MELPTRASALPPKELKLLAIIAAECDGEWCPLNQRELASRTGFNRNSISLYLTKLHIEGYLERQTPPAGNNKNHARWWYRVRRGTP